MDIGTEQPAIVVEPLEQPFAPEQPEPRREPDPEPVRVREPEKVPA